MNKNNVKVRELPLAFSGDVITYKVNDDATPVTTIVAFVNGKDCVYTVCGYTVPLFMIQSVNEDEAPKELQEKYEQYKASRNS